METKKGAAEYEYRVKLADGIESELITLEEYIFILENKDCLAGCHLNSQYYLLVMADAEACILPFHSMMPIQIGQGAGNPEAKYAIGGL